MTSEENPKVTITDNGCVMQMVTRYSNGMTVTDWCAIGRSTEWSPKENPFAGIREAAARARDNARQDFRMSSAAEDAFEVGKIMMRAS